MNCGAVKNLLPAAARSTHGVEGCGAALPVLLIGYGNLLRRDDGVGPAVVSRLAAVFSGHPGCRFITPHQLTPELAEDVSSARRVVFVDASMALPAGKVAIRLLGAGDTPEGGLGHHMSPEALLAIAGGVFARRPRAWVIGIGVSNLTTGDRLSPVVSRAAQRVCRHLAYRIRRWTAEWSAQCASQEGVHVCS